MATRLRTGEAASEPQRSGQPARPRRAHGRAAQPWPRIVLVRHAESEFNRREEGYLDTRPELRETPEHWGTDDVYDPHVWDAPLSERGRLQCAELQFAMWGHGAADVDDTTRLLRDCWLVLSSPYLRCLQTAGLVFARPDGRPPRIRVVPELGEFVTSSCDIGRSGLELLADPLLRPALDTFPSLAAQLESLPGGWWGPERREHLPPGLHIPRHHRTPVARFRERFAKALVALADEAEKGAGAGGCIAVVGHSASFHEATGCMLDNCAPTEAVLIAPANPGEPPRLCLVDSPSPSRKQA